MKKLMFLAVLIGVHPLGIAGGGQIVPERHGQVFKYHFQIIGVIHQIEACVKILGKHPVVVRVYLGSSSGDVHACVPSGYHA